MSEVNRRIERGSNRFAVIAEVGGKRAAIGVAVPGNRVENGRIHIDCADVWALGVVTVQEMVTGVRPFTAIAAQAAIYAILNDTPKNVSDLRPDAPAGVGSIIARALQKDAARRYATAADFRDNLNRCQAALPISTSGVSIADLWHGFRRSRAAVAAVCIALTIVVGAAVTWSRGAEARRVRSRRFPKSNA